MFIGCLGQGKIKQASFSNLAFYAYGAAQLFNNALHNRQAQAVAMAANFIKSDKFGKKAGLAFFRKSRCKSQAGCFSPF